MSRRELLIIVADLLIVAALLFVPAGTVSWLAGWVFMALLGGVTVAVVRMLTRNDPSS